MLPPARTEPSRRLTRARSPATCRPAERQSTPECKHPSALDTQRARLPPERKTCWADRRVEEIHRQPRESWTVSASSAELSPLPVPSCVSPWCRHRELEPVLGPWRPGTSPPSILSVGYASFPFGFPPEMLSSTTWCSITAAPRAGARPRRLRLELHPVCVAAKGIRFPPIRLPRRPWLPQTTSNHGRTRQRTVSTKHATVATFASDPEGPSAR